IASELCRQGNDFHNGPGKHLEAARHSCPLLARHRGYPSTAWPESQYCRQKLMRGLARLMVARRAERVWLALYGMEKASAVTRAAFIQRVRKRFALIKP